jgi:hypothetical protein
MMPDSFKQSKLVSSEGNKKVVDVDRRARDPAPGFKIRTRASRSPTSREKRITTKTIDFQLADITSEYKFEPADGGKATIVRVEQQNKPKTAASSSRCRRARSARATSTRSAREQGHRAGEAGAAKAADRRGTACASPRARFLGAAGPRAGAAAGPPEVAIGGRSNVGKSSLINALVGRRGLARASGTPAHAAAQLLPPERALRARRPAGLRLRRRARGGAARVGPLVEATSASGRPSAGSCVIDARRGVEAEEEQVLAFAAPRGLPVVVARRSSTSSRRGPRTARRGSRVARRARALVGFSARTGEGRVRSGASSTVVRRPRRTFEARRPNG